MTNEIDKILYRLGYYDGDPEKKADVQGYVDEAVEYMQSVGVPEDKLTTQRAFAVKSIWADYRDSGKNDEIIKKDGMVVALIANLKR